MNSNKSKPEKLAYSINEACQAVSIGRASIYAHIRSGRLKAVRVEGRTLIPTKSLKALINGSGDLREGGK